MPEKEERERKRRNWKNEKEDEEDTTTTKMKGGVEGKGEEDGKEGEERRRGGEEERGGGVKPFGGEVEISAHTDGWPASQPATHTIPSLPLFFSFSYFLYFSLPANQVFLSPPSLSRLAIPQFPFPYKAYQLEKNTQCRILSYRHVHTKSHVRFKLESLGS